ncbi:MAG: hypothetical protein K9N48_06860 [Verrucomicrobia bacterium]|nr:hypothetical protein [Verrucomicrobiota bacterium]MCF7709462.1 hypothetical protein [Verrucomicrobiota bacterium]
MSQISEFVKEGASKITPALLKDLHRVIPMWKAEFTQIKAPKQPHLIEQLILLANAVEDFLDNDYHDLPYIALAEAAFALIYVQDKINIIPDFVADIGRADDSSIVRAAIIHHEQAFEKYALVKKFNWSRVGTNP